MIRARVPYRDLAPAPPGCFLCERPEVVPCTVCARPACPRHLARSSMCVRCDEAHYAYMGRTRGDGVFLPFMVGLVAVIVGTLAVNALFPLAIAYIVLGFPVVRLTRSRLNHRAFVRSMRATGKPPQIGRGPDRDADALADYERLLAERHADHLADGLAASEAVPEPEPEPEPDADADAESESAHKPVRGTR